MQEIDSEDFIDENATKKDLYYTNGLILWIGGFLVTANYIMSGKPIEKLGFNWPKMDSLVIGLTAALVIIYLVDTYFSIKEFNREKSEESKTMEILLPHTWKEYAHYSFLAISAGICEEVIYRGFLINYLRELLPPGSTNIYFAILIPSIIFAISHLYQGWLNVLKIFTISILFGHIYVQSESLLIVIIIHVMVDLISGSVLIFNQKNQSKED